MPFFSWMTWFPFPSPSISDFPPMAHAALSTHSAGISCTCLYSRAATAQALSFPKLSAGDFPHAPRYDRLKGGHMPDYRQMVVSNPGVMMGKPVIAGTRITVESILEKLAAGETVNQLLEAHPRLTETAVRAALAFAADAMRADVVYPLETTLR
jgi:uncharacterized protein (DUF433 family)